jgi:ABC-2 type transport system permease protein
MSALFRVTMMATQLLAIIVMPSFLLSGFTWQMLGMAPFAHVIALAMPLTHYLILVRRITMLGDGIVQMREPIQALAIWTLFALFFAWITVWRVLKTEGAQP